MDSDLISDSCRYLARLFRKILPKKITEICCIVGEKVYFVISLETDIKSLKDDKPDQIKVGAGRGCKCQ